MAARKPQREDAEVSAFMAALEHPMKAQLEALRRALLAVSPRVSEGLKWNAPSFRTTEWFATFNLPKQGARLVLHLGAKAKGVTVKLDDPRGLLAWRGGERALITFTDGADLEAKLPAVKALVKQWLSAVG